jgi:hypothetical protein
MSSIPISMEETIGSIARLHAEHHQNARRFSAPSIALLGRPRFNGVQTVIAAGWISLRLAIALSIRLPSQGWRRGLAGVAHDFPLCHVTFGLEEP